jgi:hypothetical protein
MANTKQHTPNSRGITPIKVNSLALSNAAGHCSPYNVHGKGSTSAWMEPVSIGASPTVSVRANQKPMAGSQTSSKGGHK